MGSLEKDSLVVNIDPVAPNYTLGSGKLSDLGFSSQRPNEHIPPDFANDICGTVGGSDRPVNLMLTKF